MKTAYLHTANGQAKPFSMTRSVSGTLRTMLCLLSCSMLFSFSNLSSAEENVTPVSLTPYHAKYSAEWRGGSIPMKVNAERSLSRVNKNQWKFAFQASAKIASIKESSVFSVDGKQIKPSKYHYEQRALFNKRIAHVDFEWGQGKFYSKYKKDKWELKAVPEALDKLSYQQQAQLDLALGKTTFSYQVIDKGKIKPFEFKIIGEESLKTPMGVLNTIKMEKQNRPGSKRSTTLWFAKDLDYQLVRLYQEEKNGSIYEINMTEYHTTTD